MLEPTFGSMDKVGRDNKFRGGGVLCYGPRVQGLGVLQKREIKERKFFIVLLAFYYIFDSYI